MKKEPWWYWLGFVREFFEGYVWGFSLGVVTVLFDLDPESREAKVAAAALLALAIWIVIVIWKALLTILSSNT